MESLEVGVQGLMKRSIATQKITFTHVTGKV